jgi:putative aldouronate transport system permease protein
VPGLNHTRAGLFDWINNTLLLFVALLCIFPFLHIAAVSLSDGVQVSAGRVLIVPDELNLESYRYILSSPRLNVLQGLLNSLSYTLVGTTVSVAVTFMTAYALSRKKLRGRHVIMMIFLFTYVFEAGIIPNYIVWSKLGLVNNFWVMVLPTAVHTFFLIVTKTYLDGLPFELEEAATIDGAHDLRIMWNVFRPLSAPVLATITVFYAVTIWNQFLIPLIYLQDNKLHPIQLVLYNLIIKSSTTATNLENIRANGVMLTPRTLQAAAIITAVFPILFIYPFAQKYFTKGFLVGSIKG